MLSFGQSFLRQPHHCSLSSVAVACLLGCLVAWLLASLQCTPFLGSVHPDLGFPVEWTHQKWNTHIIKRNTHHGTLILSKGILIIKMEHSYYQKEYSSWNTHTIKRNTHHQNGTLIGTLHM